MHKKIPIVAGIAILFLGLCIIPSVAIYNVKESSLPIFDMTVIIVDDEGDGDYTYIRDALNHSVPGDTIEVYSGFYYEKEIVINTENITLRGIPYELGAGDDSGKPAIKDITEPYDFIIVKNSNIIIDGFIIIGGEGAFWNNTILIREGDNNVISNCDIIKGNGLGYVIVTRALNNIKIINNNISGGNTGIFIMGTQNCVIGNKIHNSWRRGIFSNSARHCNITGNLISGCDTGIELEYYSGLPKSYNITIKNNIINSCGVGINMDNNCNKSIIVRNEFKNNGIAIETAEYKNRVKMFYQNNFIKNSKDVIININSWVPSFLTFFENYWDKRNHIGPMRIVNIKFIFTFFPILIPILKIVAFDLHPAKEPYDIEV